MKGRAKPPILRKTKLDKGYNQLLSIEVEAAAFASAVEMLSQDLLF